MAKEILEINLPNINASRHGGDVYTLDKPSSIIDYSVCISPFGPPKSFDKKVFSLKNKMNLYPDINYKSATDTISKYFKLESNNVMIGNGVEELVYIAVQTLKPRKALIPMPTYTEYRRACRNFGCEVVPYKLLEENNFRFDVNDFIQKIGESIDVVILCNPNNPTGRIVDKTSLKILFDYCQSKGIYIIIDETYMDFVTSDNSVITLVERYPNLVVLRSLSHYNSVPGLRVGYTVACEGLIDLMKDNQYPWSVNILASAVCENAFNDVKYNNQTKKWLQTEPIRFYELIKSINNIRAIKPSANYIFIKLEEMLASVLCKRMLEKGFLIRNASNFDFLDDHYIRIGVKDKKTNDKFFDKFSRCML